MNYSLSPIDEHRFGVRTAKVELGSNSSIEELLRQAVLDDVEFLIARIPTTETTLIQELERHAFMLTDTLIYYRKHRLAECDGFLKEGYSVRLATTADGARLEELAATIFADYRGHYHADPKLDRDSCNQVYSSWARRSCEEKGVADAVTLIEHSGELVAFATQKKCPSSTFEGVLFGVSPSHTNKGLHRALMMQSENWGVAQKQDRMITSTQIVNVTVQRNWCRQGFEPFASYYTFHYWRR